jgi:hypothetical protein
MVSEAEYNLALQAILKFEANPAYLPSKEELDACLAIHVECAKSILRKARWTLIPEEKPQEKFTKIFEALDVWDQNRIRQHEMELISAKLDGLCDADMNLLLKRFRLNLLPHNVVWICIAELFQARVYQSGLTEAELGKDAALEYEKCFAFDPDYLTVDQIARREGIELVVPDGRRGNFVGSVVASDHRSFLVLFCRAKALAIPFCVLAEGQERPCVGDSVSMKFNEGTLEMYTY